MADVFDFQLRIMRDGETWYAVGSSDERYRIGDWERFATAVTPLLYGLALVRVERDGRRIPLGEWCDPHRRRRARNRLLAENQPPSG